MSLFQKLAGLAVRPLFTGACHFLGISAGASVADFLQQRFTDHAQKLHLALGEAEARAWQTLELALGGDTVLEQCQRWLAPVDQQALGRGLRELFVELAGEQDTLFRSACLAELRWARKRGLLQRPEMEPGALAATLTACSDPEGERAGEWRWVEEIAEELRAAGCPTLARLLNCRPDERSSLLGTLVRYFFRRAVETDAELARGLTFAQLDELQSAQAEGLLALERLLSEAGERLELLLGQVQASVESTLETVLDIQAEQTRHGERQRELYEAVIAVQQRLDLLQRHARPRDSLSIRSEAERRLVQQLVARYRRLPEEERQRLPALLNAVGKLELAAGEFEPAQRDFQTVANLVNDPVSRGQAHLNAYRAALERRDWDSGLRELLAAVRLDGRRFAPFPVGKYPPRRILGAGGFGVAFLCRHPQLGAEVVVKTLLDDELGRSVEEIFAEARALWELDHPAIIRLLDCAYTLPPEKSRPYLVMPYFDGLTLEDHVRQHGPLSSSAAVAIALQLVDGLQAAHARSILHRDVKPGNVLIRCHGEGSPQAKLIDFGLAAPQTMRTATRISTSLCGVSIHGTLDYAAPEQLGKLPGAPVNPSSDLFALARTICFALFGTPVPRRRHWQQLPEPLADLLDDCLAETPDERPASAAEALQRLRLIAEGKATSTPPPVLNRGGTDVPVCQKEADRNVHPTSVQLPTLDWDTWQIDIQPRQLPACQQPGWPPLAEELLEAEGTVLALQETVQQVRAESHPDLQVARAQLHAAEEVWERLTTELQAQAPALSLETQEKLAQAVASNPEQPFANFSALAPLTPPRLLRAHLERLRQLEEVRQACQSGAQRYTEARAQEMARLSDLLLVAERRVALLRDADLENVVQTYRKCHPRADSARAWEKLAPLLAQRRQEGPDVRQQVLHLLTRADKEDRCFRTAQRLGTLEGIAAFLSDFPHSRHASQLDEQAWMKARRNNTAESYSAYLTAIPRGRHARAASLLLGQPWLRAELPGIPGEACAVAFSPNGEWLAGGGGDQSQGVVKVWDAGTGAERWTLTGHTDRVRRLCFLAGSTWLASASDDHTIRIWDVSTGAAVLTFTEHEWPVLAMIPGGGERLLSGDGSGRVLLWNARTGTIEDGGLVELARLSCLALRSTGEVAAGSETGEVAVWERSGGTPIRFTSFEGRLHSLAYSPDGVWLVGSGQPRSSWLPACVWWLTDTLSPLARRPRHLIPGERGVIQGLTFSPDSQALAGLASDHELLVWRQEEVLCDLRPLTGRRPNRRQFPLHERTTAFSPDGKLLAAAWVDGLIRLWELPPLERLGALREERCGSAVEK